MPAERVVAKTDAVAVSLGRLWVYPAGLELEVSVYADDEWADFDPFEMERFHRASGPGEPSPDRLLVGFGFADGTKATTASEGPGWAQRSGERSPVLLQRRGDSGEGRWRQTYWLWPLPPPGQLEFVCEWGAAGIPLTRAELDAAAIIAAASRAKTIFPDDAEAGG